MAGMHGHVVLRSPVKHCELNAIELVWADVKTWIGHENVTFKMKDVQRLVTAAFAHITKGQWASSVKHTI